MANMELTKPPEKICSSSRILCPPRWRAKKPLNSSLVGSIDSRMLPSIGIVIEAAAIFASVQARIHHLLQQWARAKFAVSEFFVEDLNREQDGIQPDQVCCFQRAHLV